MTTHNRKEKYREDMREEIKAAAWEMLAESGAAGLTLNGISRRMGLTTPALYRYFSDRAGLLAALLEDAYRSLAAALEAARDRLPADEPARRLCAAGVAYREWALASPRRYLVSFGEGHPGLPLPPGAGEQADRCFLILVGILSAAHQAGKLHLPAGYPAPSAALQAQLEELSRRGGGRDPLVLLIALSLWSKLHGLASLELYGHSAYMLHEERAEFYRVELEYFLSAIGLG